MLRRLSAIGVYWDYTHDHEVLARLTEQLSTLAAGGAIRPHVGAVFAFDELPKALAALGDRGTTGKVIVKTG